MLTPRMPLYIPCVYNAFMCPAVNERVVVCMYSLDVEIAAQCEARYWTIKVVFVLFTVNRSIRALVCRSNIMI